MVKQLDLQWQYFNPVRIDFGCGALSNLPNYISDINGTVLFITTKGFVRRGIISKVRGLIGNSDCLVCDKVTPNPEITFIAKLINEYKNRDIRKIVAIGGGSAIDVAKVLGVTLSSQFNNDFSLDCVLAGNFLNKKEISVIAIPTTAGTGAEVTPFATVWDEVTGRKYSVFGDDVYPNVAIVDPELTLSLPYDQTLFTGLDAAAHALESLWNKNRTYMSQMFAYRSLTLVNRSFIDVLHDLQNLSLRTCMHEASLLSGGAISQTRTAISHAISYSLTGNYGVPHGLACGVTLHALIDDYLRQEVSDFEKTLLLDMTDILDALDIKSKIKKYFDLNKFELDINNIVGNPRSSNYIGEISEGFVDDLLKKVF